MKIDLGKLKRAGFTVKKCQGKDADIIAIHGKGPTPELCEMFESMEDEICQHTILKRPDAIRVVDEMRERIDRLILLQFID